MRHQEDLLSLSSSHVVYPSLETTCDTIVGAISPYPSEAEGLQLSTALPGCGSNGARPTSRPACGPTCSPMDPPSLGLSTSPQRCLMVGARTEEKLIKLCAYHEPIRYFSMAFLYLFCCMNNIHWVGDKREVILYLIS